MKNYLKNYIALFEANENGGYSVVFPDFPGCISAGDSYEDAYIMAHEALSCHTDGEKLPKPRTLEQIKKNWPDWKEWELDGNFLVVPITLIPNSNMRRINVTIPEDILHIIDAKTNNRSAFFTSSARMMLGMN